MPFHDIEFPLTLSSLTPKTAWNTQVTELGGGGEQRASLFGDAKRRYDARTAETLLLTNFDSVEKFFNARRGKYFSYKLTDRTNWKATAEGFGIGDGSTTTFQLSINRGDASNAYNREIYLPKSGTLTVFDNATPVVEGSGAGKFLVDYNGANGGLVTFGTAPVNTHVLTATFEYYIPVRFEIDEFPSARMFAWIQSGNTGLLEGPEIPLIEVRYQNEF